MKRKIDILCIGETLIDFIGHQEDTPINKITDYHRYLGGSPTNVAMNASRLGLKSALISTVGQDGLGDYILEKLNSAGIITSQINRLREKSTSVILISKSTNTPEFISHRDADFHIIDDQLSTEVIASAKIFHTTCFALSRNPARSTILKKAKEASKLGCQLSIDLNYSNKVWENKEDAIQAITTYCSLNPLIKISEDDSYRLFGKNISHQEIFNFFHNLGADKVCLTLGSKGVKLSEKNNEMIELPAIEVKQIIDTTGAGDAFWSGFLYAFIKNKNLHDCIQSALKLAALKLQNVGRLPEDINILSAISE
ncbi:MAG: carbohydrate kinase family protein [Bacteroidia bacterium]